MSDQLKKDVKELVDNIFKQKEETAMRQEIEDALRQSTDEINNLNTSLEAKDGEIKDFQAEVSELNDTVSELEMKIVDLEKDKENLEKEKTDLENEKADIVKRAEDAEKELEDIRKDQLAQARFDDLTNSGVAATNDKAKEDQISKIREMSDEDFTAYKEELVAVRESIVAELKKSDDTNNNNDDPSKATAAAEGEDKEEILKARLEELKEAGVEAEDEDKVKDMTDEEFATYKEELVVENAADDNDDEGSVNLKKAMAAALNMETIPGKDVMSKYRELGQAMADMVKKEK